MNRDHITEAYAETARDAAAYDNGPSYGEREAEYQALEYSGCEDCTDARPCASCKGFHDYDERG